ncbi:MAG: polysaccharide deacetylase family protein [Abditibacteriales bacterium]|nr:polysaccharide deacetylase family protein [Abditibacteriales bacterium]MDW8366102.1 polysaccharide deacetylase family protein [Abditibacteriales bacterium]
MYIIITIDTEVTNRQGCITPIEKTIYGEIGGQSYGITRIMDLCEAFNVKATFFVDVFASHYFGEDAIRQVCQEIQRRGHDVQLHTHPHWLDNKPNLCDYDLQRQMELIAHGKALLTRWLGKPPVAHRAGAFAANADTLTALKRNGILLDCSQFVAYPRCKLGKLSLPVNAVSEVDGVVELPVTSFVELQIGRRRKWRLLDVDADTVAEIKHVLCQAQRRGLPVVTLLLHSFSFVNWNKEGTRFWADHSDLAKFEAVLRFVRAQPHMEVITVAEFARLYRAEPERFHSEDVVPYTGWGLTLWRACRQFNKSRKNQALVALAATPFMAALIYGLACYFRQ